MALLSVHQHELIVWRLSRDGVVPMLSARQREAYLLLLDADARDRAKPVAMNGYKKAPKPEPCAATVAIGGRCMFKSRPGSVYCGVHQYLPEPEE